MRKNIWWLLAVAVVLILAAFQACGGGDAPVAQISATLAPSDTPEPTPSPTPEPTDTPAPTDTPEPTPSPAPEPTEAPADTPAPEKTEELVWIPTNGGTKYHSKAACSNMIDPEQVPLSEAVAMGFEPCKRCH